jgi:hypothetical protein
MNPALDDPPNGSVTSAVVSVTASESVVMFSMIRRAVISFVVLAG